jgi:hypothetical protein
MVNQPRGEESSPRGLASLLRDKAGLDGKRGRVTEEYCVVAWNVYTAGLRSKGHRHERTVKAIINHATTGGEMAGVVFGGAELVSAGSGGKVAALADARGRIPEH